MRFEVLEPPRTYLLKLLADKALHTSLYLHSCVLRGFDVLEPPQTHRARARGLFE